MSGTQETFRVLVSYTQESAAHRVRCRELADRLRNDGIEAWIDQYVPAPPEGWPRWMEQQIAAAKFVILVCTPTFRRRFEGREAPGVGRGASWEGLISTQLLYDNGARNDKLVPVLFEDAVEEAVPVVLRPFTRYTLWTGYDALLRHLSDQPATLPPPVGSRKVLPPVSGGASCEAHAPGGSPATQPPGGGAARTSAALPPGADAVLGARGREQALCELLNLLFEPNELRMWLRFNADGEAVVRGLPGDSVSRAELVFKATDLLIRRGLVSAEFFERLLEHSPRQAAVIDHVQARWLEP